MTVKLNKRQTTDAFGTWIKALVSRPYMARIRHGCPEYRALPGSSDWPLSVATSS